MEEKKYMQRIVYLKYKLMTLSAPPSPPQYHTSTILASIHFNPNIFGVNLKLPLG